MRLLILFTAIFLLSSCGFSPMYGDSTSKNNTAIKTELSNVDIAIIPDREGQYLRNALIDRFYINGIPASPKYRLQINKVTENISNFDVTIDSEVTRRQLKLITTMFLIDLETGKPVLKRNLQAITSYNVLESEFSTIVTEQSARDAALDDIARQIERNTVLYFKK
jgi:LPS-assembly lipoprotein